MVHDTVQQYTTSLWWLIKADIYGKIKSQIFVRLWGLFSNGLELSSHSFKLTFQKLLNLENRMTPKASEIWIRKEGNP